MVKNTIAIDAMGGDKAPKSVIAGLAISAIRNPDTNYIIYGDENEIYTSFNVFILSIMCDTSCGKNCNAR